MNERPILFSTPMVKALLAGNKTETRRILKANSHVAQKEKDCAIIYNQYETLKHEYCPYGKPGDLLWVREMFQPMLKGTTNIHGSSYVYKADWGEGGNSKISYGGKWKPSIHMPKEAARIWLKITNIRVERLQDISEESADNEGVYNYLRDEDIPHGYEDYLNQTCCFDSAIESFKSLWIFIHGTKSWKANPWLWVVEFKVISTTGKPSNLTPKP